MPQTFTLIYEVYQDNDGDPLWVALCLNLPGLGTQGDTEAEAHTMFQEAATGILESYLADNAPIPWDPTNQEQTPGSTLHNTTITIQDNLTPNINKIT